MKRKNKRKTELFNLSQELRDIEGKLAFADEEYETILLAEWELVLKRMDAEVLRMKALEKEKEKEGTGENEKFC